MKKITFFLGAVCLWLMGCLPKTVISPTYDFNRVQRIGVMAFNSPWQSVQGVENLFAKYLLESGFKVVERAQLEKDLAYDQLKLQIASLYVKITNSLVTLKTLSESAAVYQGAGALNLEEFHNGNMNIENYAGVKLHESDLVSQYQALQTTITTDILTLEILTHTPILTNSTTEITLDSSIHKTEKQIAKENKAVEKRIKKAAKEEEKRIEEIEKQEKKAQKATQKK